MVSLAFKAAKETVSEALQAWNIKMRISSKS